MKRYFALLILILLMNLCHCGEQNNINVKNDLTEIKQIPMGKWDVLKSKKIYFGHQSVGFNIVNGIELIMKQVPTISLNIQEIKTPDTLESPVFAHSRIGQNKDPLSKIMDFKNYIQNGIGDSADYAFFKLCYIDIKEDSDVQQVFTAYKNVLDSLILKFPNTTFLHVTVPLRIAQTGIKVSIKNLIGQAIGGYADNIKRNEFNELLLNEYGNTGMVFDLAGAESTYPDGRPNFFEKNGKKYSFLIPAYTQDGGHLNNVGRTIVAEKLLLFLADQIGETVEKKAEQ